MGALRAFFSSLAAYAEALVANLREEDGMPVPGQKRKLTNALPSSAQLPSSVHPAPRATHTKRANRRLGILNERGETVSRPFWRWSDGQVFPRPSCVRRNRDDRSIPPCRL